MPSNAVDKSGRRMLLWISEAALAARQDANASIEGIADTAGLSANSIRNFEHGDTWPKNIDRVISAYAEKAGLPDGLALWQAALDLWYEHGSAPMIGRREDGRASQRAVEIVREQANRSRQAARSEADATSSAIRSTKAPRRERRGAR